MTYKITGTTYDNVGDILGGCDCYLLKYNSGTDIFTQVDFVTSNASTGAYSFTAMADNDPYYAVAFYLSGTPDLFDITDRNLIPVLEGPPGEWSMVYPTGADFYHEGVATAHNFNAIPIGTAAGDRKCYVCVAAASEVNITATPVVVLGGVTLTKVVDRLSGGILYAGVFSGTVPTGTAADLSITYPVSVTRSAGSIFTATGSYSVLTSDGFSGSGSVVTQHYNFTDYAVIGACCWAFGGDALPGALLPAKVQVIAAGVETLIAAYNFTYIGGVTPYGADYGFYSNTGGASNAAVALVVLGTS